MPASPIAADLRIDGALSIVGGAVVLVVGLISGATYTWMLAVVGAVTVVLGLFGLRRRRRALAAAAAPPAELTVGPRPREHWLHEVLVFVCPLSVAFTWPLLTAAFGVVFACAGVFELVHAGVLARFERTHDVRVLGGQGNLFLEPR
jgi:hypothetical protein